MATTTKIRVTACDNELYILASNPFGTSQLCHLKSGQNKPVDYTIFPQSILPQGAYTLILVGINWGGPQAFKVIVTTGGTDTPYTAPGGSNVGATWTVAVPMTL
jgi:chemotaxis response regulator CheB